MLLQPLPYNSAPKLRASGPERAREVWRDDLRDQESRASLPAGRLKMGSTNSCDEFDVPMSPKAQCRP